MRYEVTLYTQASVKVQVEADTPDQAVDYARQDAGLLEYELVDPNEIVADWTVETNDWEFLDWEELP